MSDQDKINRLMHALGLALGALEVIELTSYDFNKDGVALIIDRLRKESALITQAPIKLEDLK